MAYENRNRKFPPEESSFRAKVSNFKALAKTRGIAWSLTLEEGVEIIKQNCFYCGSPPSAVYNSILSRTKAEKIQTSMTDNHRQSGDIKRNGIDRLDSTIGYLKNNVVPCCKTCNFAKNELTVREFYDWVQKIQRNFKI